MKRMKIDRGWLAGKNRIIALLFTVSANIAGAQHTGDGHVKHYCGTMIADSIMRAKHPGLGTLDQFEEWFRQKIQENKQAAGKTAVSYTLPVVFHVIHNGDGVGVSENISEAQVQSQMDVLNRNFNNANPDAAKLNTTYAASNWSSIIANCGINFCLTKADRNNDSMAVPGIDRIHIDSVGLKPPPYSLEYLDDTLKPATIWDPNKFLNIWVVKEINSIDGGTILGYARFPVSSGLEGLTGQTGTAYTDGVTLVFNVVGTTGTLMTGYKKGNTASHEVGHWLGLRHIWGDYDCGEDYCDDTPLQYSLTDGCPSYPKLASECDPDNTNPYGINYTNFMDYSNDNCQFMFTNDQKARMITALQNCPFRVSLVSQSCEIKKITMSDSITVFPNPTDGKVEIAATSPIRDVKVYNLLGEIVAYKNETDRDLTIDLTGFTNGIYFVKVESGSYKKVQKIILNAP